MLLFSVRFRHTILLITRTFYLAIIFITSYQLTLKLVVSEFLLKTVIVYMSLILSALVLQRVVRLKIYG